MLLSFVFSFRNEEENIPELVKQVTAAIAEIPELTHEMIFVNDDSSDRSFEVLSDLQKNHPITIINMSRRFGVTPCVLAGFARAKGEAVVYLDTDLQDPPELIPQMVAKFREGAEVVHTTRTHRDGESPAKMWITKMAYRVINKFADIRLPENTGDYKLLSRKVVEHILALPEADPYLRGLAVWVGFRQEFIYYRRRPRFSGETHFPLFGKGPAREFIRGLTSFSATPLLFSLFIGFATVFLAVALIVYAIITKLLGLSAPGASGTLIAVAFFSGMVLITNGVIGLYVARIYNEVKGRPKYIIKNVIEPNRG
jgi:polyisoprenyl-phosphate glycosyltransferase